MLEKVLTNVFMMIKEVIEIIAGIIVFSFPRAGVYIEARICIFCIPLILIALYPLLMNYISHIATYQV
jgi:hypothetical protein